MLDPGSAIGLVGNILQFITFTRGVITESIELHNSADGALGRNTEIENVASRLRVLTSKFYGTESPSKVDEADLELESLCHDLYAISGELLRCLERLKTGPKKQKWDSIRKALTSVMKESEIKILEERLDRYRNQLDTTLLISLRRWVEHAQAERGIIHAEQKHIQDQQKKDLEDIKASLAIMIKECRLYSIMPIRSSKDGHYPSSISSSRPTVQRIPRDFSFEHRMEKDYEEYKVRDLVAALRFEDMLDRHDAIHQPHQKTYKWIFDKTLGYDIGNETPSVLSGEWANYTKWLQSESNIYWITGKPGAGKSTLMKFICDHDQTLKYAREWAYKTPPNQVPSSSQVVVNVNDQSLRASLFTASFFFWNAGTETQKSKLSLLRTLLCHLIREINSNQLVAELFPDRWLQYEFFSHNARPFTWSELTRAFETLLSDTNKRFLLFVDGLDEFEGDCADLADFILKLSERPNVKICTSSRPWPVFETRLRSKPMLRMEDLTRRDINIYITEKFNESQCFVDLQRVRPQDAKELINEIADKALGVFLWVYLAVRSLLEGLVDGDEIIHLHQRLLELPSDMEQFYERMLHKLNAVYAREASEMLQFFRAYPDRSILPAVVLACHQVRYVVEHPPWKSVSEGELQHSLQMMRRRLYSRCQCFLEVDKTPKQLSKVRFLHRTANEYLSQSSVWASVVANSPGYNPGMACNIASVIKLHAKNGRKDSAELHEMMERAKGCTTSEKVEFLEAVDKLKPVFSLGSGRFPRLSTASEILENARDMQRYEWYFIAKLEKHPTYWQKPIGDRYMLILAAHKRMFALQQKALENGADPNYREQKYTPWIIILKDIQNMDAINEQLVRLLEVYLDHNADITERITWRNSSESIVRRAISIAASDDKLAEQARILDEKLQAARARKKRAK